LFNGDWEDGLSFDHAKFTGNIQFSESNFFFGILSFNNAEFLTKFNFHYIKINLDNFTLANAKFFMGGEIDFFDFHAKTINLSNTIFKGRVNFTIGSIFFKNLEIINAHFSDATGLDKLFVSTGNNGKIKFKLKEYKFFLGPNSAARYPILHKKNQDAWFLYEFKSQHPLIFNIWKFTSNCGQSLLRWSIISFFIALIFGLIYGFVGIPGFEMKHQTWFSFFYYSIVTFTTLGFGDITPKIWYTEILVSIEVIIGYFMLGGLVSIFSNKFARRS